MSNTALSPDDERGRARPYAAPPRKLALVHDLAAAPDHTLLSTHDLVALTGFAPITFRQWRAKGRGPKETRVEGLPRYLWGDVKRWLEAA